MIKFICDRCGSEFDMAFLTINRKAIIMEGLVRKEYDLCKKCVCEVREFITGQTGRNE